MRRLASRIALQAGRLCIGLSRALYLSPQERRLLPWLAAEGDATLRVDYDLDQDSLVFDLGGFTGQWASDIFGRYACRIEIFEAVPEFAERVAARFRKNPRVAVHPFGLAAVTGTARIGLAGDASSLYAQGVASREIRLVRAADFCRERGIRTIDLMKINIEGGEYDLLEHLVDSGLVRSIRDLQVQFHDFVPDAERRMKVLQARLSESHAPTYRYPFVWENWRRRGGA